jgi:hypothetical protein
MLGEVVEEVDHFLEEMAALRHGVAGQGRQPALAVARLPGVMVRVRLPVLAVARLPGVVALVTRTALMEVQQPGVVALVTRMVLMAVRQPGAILIILLPCRHTAIVPPYIMATPATAEVMSRRQESPAWRSALWRVPQWHPTMPLLLPQWWYNSRWR